MANRQKDPGMCGLAGAFGRLCRSRARAVDAVVETLASFRRRGPDGVGLYVDDNAVLGQTYLQIYQPSAVPTVFVSPERRYVVFMNGQIYNTRDLATGLGVDYHHLTSDLQLLALGFEAKGWSFVDELDGMFAIATYDRRRNEIMLARDPVGIRPLYWARAHDGVIFASEPFAVASIAQDAYSFDHQSIFESLLLRYPIEPTTMYPGICAVQPGTVITYRESHWRTRASRRPFLLPTINTLPEEPEDIDTRCRRTIEYATRRRIPKACRYATFLSGGLDSTIVSALTPVSDEQRLPSIVCGFGGAEEEDERCVADRAATALGVDLELTTVSPSVFVATWPWLLEALGSPLMFNSSIPMYWMCRRISALGGKVVLSGEGADELFLGYGRYRHLANEAIERKDFNSLFVDDDEITQFPSVKNWYKSHDQVDERIHVARRRMLDILDELNGIDAPLVRQRQLLDCATFLRALLMRQDRCGLSTGVEIRVPFLDESVVQVALSMKHTHLIGSGQGKAVLRAAFRSQVGSSVALGKKVGFPVPIGCWVREGTFDKLSSWLNSELNRFSELKSDLIAQALQRVYARTPGATQELWTLLNLAAWMAHRRSGGSAISEWEAMCDDEGREAFEEVRSSFTYNWEHGRRLSRAADSYPALVAAGRWDEDLEVTLVGAYVVNDNPAQ